MSAILTEDTLSQLSEFIAFNFALNFPRDRWGDLERNIRIAATEFGYTNIEEFIQHIIAAPLTHERMEILAASLTIGETYFWREPNTFDALKNVIIPEIIHHRLNGEKRIRIWSAGCSTGEEPYSIAIALRETIPFIKDWNISILATDINPRSLRKASAGEYGKWSFRGASPWLKEKYFTQKPNGRLEIIPEIKGMVKFEYLNLAEDIYPSSLNDTNAMDIIYCRNVLMYFSQERFRQVVRDFYKSLVQGGYLLVSASELSLQNFPDFTPVNVQGMVLYKKTSVKIKKPRQISVLETPPEPSFLEPIPKPETSENTKYQPQLVDSEVSKEISSLADTNYEKSLKYYSEGRYGDAVEALQNVELNDKEQILLIRALANVGKLADAINACEKVILSSKSDPRVHYLYATILQENNQLNEAVASLKRAVYLDPNFVLAYYSLGNIYKQLGNAKAAKKSYEIVVSILDKSGQADILFESEGLTVGRFKEIISASLKAGV